METTRLNENFHIHELLNALYQDQTPRSLKDLEVFIAEKFGNRPLFSSCSQENMGPSEAIDFMLMREKIMESSPGLYIINSGRQCNH